jgi:transcriptional regulator with XRE-family HTH domain
MKKSRSDQIRQAVAAAMQSQFLGQATLAAATGTSQQQISEYLAGKREITTATLGRIMEALALRIGPD